MTPSPTDETPPGQGEVAGAVGQAPAILMRRVLDQPKQWDPRKHPHCLQEGAFFPRKSDDTGLSLTQRRTSSHPEFLDEYEFKARCGDPKHRLTCGVVAIDSAAVEEVGLTVAPDPIPPSPDGTLPGDPGHVLLPQISWAAWNDEASREQVRKWASKLAKHDRISALIEPGG